MFAVARLCLLPFLASAEFFFAIAAQALGTVGYFKSLVLVSERLQSFRTGEPKQEKQQTKKPHPETKPWMVRVALSPSQLHQLLSETVSLQFLPRRAKRSRLQSSFFCISFLKVFVAGCFCFWGVIDLFLDLLFGLFCLPAFIASRTFLLNSLQLHSSTAKK